MTSEISIFNEIVKRKIGGVMFHEDMANIMDFMGLRGFKREHEYRALKEFADMRSVERYAINHINYIPNGNGANREVNVIPSNWYNASRFQVSDGERKSKLKELYTYWQKWENETKLFLQHSFQELVELGAIASANKVNELICDVDYELKCLEREMLTYCSLNWEMLYIVEKQDAIHEKYKQKTKENIHIDLS